ncbi:MAG: tyrosine-protein phosphatase [Polynucleobacter sp.]|uniref:tyrosine-protein phosphatase n=1 Tax=Polynucleobacter sp. TaxID=2029855 RepID=UPI00271ED54C|nr:tyrosine-protein phosphatase [Polynucleobacter sp.]MDO8714391.1 tyrosine-protein phosphatase [Polynucleobacter sp.]
MRDFTISAFKFFVFEGRGVSRRTFAKYLFVIAIYCVGSFALAQAPSAVLAPGESLGIFLNISPVPNLRDLGGYATKNGDVVVRGMAYRSNEFYAMDAEDLIKLQALKLKTDYDLRTSAEIDAQPDNIPPEITYVRLNVMAGEDLITPPDQINILFQNPKLATQKWGGAKGVEASFIALYRDFVLLPSAQKSYRILFLSLSDFANLPGVFHCTNGKDRTGWGAAALLTFLGVPKDQVFSDYLRSNDYLLPMHQKEIDAFIAGGGDPGIPAALFGVKQQYLEASFDEMYKRYGTIEQYFSEGLKINATEQKHLREMYLMRGRGVLGAN